MRQRIKNKPKSTIDLDATLVYIAELQTNAEGVITVTITPTTQTETIERELREVEDKLKHLQDSAENITALIADLQDTKLELENLLKR